MIRQGSFDDSYIEIEKERVKKMEMAVKEMTMKIENLSKTNDDLTSSLESLKSNTRNNHKIIQKLETAHQKMREENGSLKEKEKQLQTEIGTQIAQIAEITDAKNNVLDQLNKFVEDFEKFKKDSNESTIDAVASAERKLKEVFETKTNRLKSELERSEKDHQDYEKAHIVSLEEVKGGGGKYSIGQDLECDFTTVGTYEYDIDGVGHFTVDVIDSVTEYVNLMQSIFDFSKIKSLLSGDLSGEKKLRVLLDSMHGATGPYISTILADILGADSKDLLRTVPKPDFGGGHPDQNLTYAKALVDQLKNGEHDLGAAFDGDGDRNMILGRNGFFVTPSDSLAVIADNINSIPYFQSRKVGQLYNTWSTCPGTEFPVKMYKPWIFKAIPGNEKKVLFKNNPGICSFDADLVAKAKGLQVYETPTGWKYFGNLMDARKIALCGEESFGTGSDHIREKDGVWALLAWLQILADKKQSVEEIVNNHWKKYGRNVFTRYDYENVDAAGANLLMTFLEAQLPALVGRDLSANGFTYKVAVADNFQYNDPVDGSVSTRQGLRIVFEDGSRLVFRLSETGSAGATIRLYVDSYIPASDSQRLLQPAQDLLKPLVLIALETCKMEQFTNRKAPTVIT
ncbi:unnamed protein product [Caenorhabditis angaria]|uniref:Uncharacterized protein n=1 Tax=Caenorhabditis angaria TaxID=860376 RepID=A0A9P1IFK0_9PELO|nr:unnamed protein product [Caenorhabditis angaria]